jgi:hypothetical protein
MHRKENASFAIIHAAQYLAPKPDLIQQNYIPDQ